MAVLTQIEAKYLLFDAMLAVQELSWATQLPTLVVEMIAFDRALTEFYFSLDKFKDLVHTSYVNQSAKQAVVDSFVKDIAPRLTAIQESLKEHSHRFRNFTVAQKQINALWKLKEQFNIE